MPDGTGVAPELHAQGHRGGIVDWAGADEAFRFRRRSPRIIPEPGGVMGLLGTYLDALPEVARDRLIEAQCWGMGALVDPAGNRCLLGHAEDWLYQGNLFRNRAAAPELQQWRVQLFGTNSHLEIGRRFDLLCHRRGLERAVRLVKVRAARQHAVVRAQPEASHAASRGAAVTA
jgi:hypothetical protein